MILQYIRIYCEIHSNHQLQIKEEIPIQSRRHTHRVCQSTWGGTRGP